MTDDIEPPPELPEYRDNPFINRLPPVKSSLDALHTLMDLPKFNEEERRYPPHLRAHCILRLGRYFYPLERHLVLESRIAALLRQGYVGRNPVTGDYLRRLQNDHERVSQRDMQAVRHSLPSTASSFALIGCSGMGKSKSIERVLRHYPQVIHHSEPISLHQVVWLKLDCPHLGSPKQLCISFFHEMDRLLGTRYQARYGSSRFSVDEMIIRMGHVADMHALGLLAVDEIQHLMQARGTGPDGLLNFLVTLVNTIGIPVMIIGTLGALPLLQEAFRQARRASGLGSLVWEWYEADETWNHFVKRMWKFQWTTEPAPLTDDIRQVLYEESQGIVDIVIKLFMLAQLHTIQIGVLRGRPERMDAALLRHVARENFQIIRPMIDALKRNDRTAVAKYDDLRPLQDCVGQIFGDAAMRLSPAPARPMPSQEPSGGGDDAPDNTTEPILRALEGLGLARDIAELMLAQVAAENPGLSPIDLVARISERLRQRGPEAKPVKPRKIRIGGDKPPALSDERDLRGIAAKAKEEGKSVYEAFQAVGIIKAPAQDFAA